MIRSLFDLLLFINRQLNAPFLREYAFYLGLLNLIVLAVTLKYLIRYTSETENTRIQISKQTELEQSPILLLFIRNIMDGEAYAEEIAAKKFKLNKFLIRIRSDEKSSGFYLRIRSVGKGTAFNVTVESDLFDVVDYEAQFFSPLSDEHSIAIVQKGNKKIENWKMFDNSIFTIKCNDLYKKNYEFKYRIIDFKNEKIEYLG
jgi:hypothetical protein